MNNSINQEYFISKITLDFKQIYYDIERGGGRGALWTGGGGSGGGGGKGNR